MLINKEQDIVKGILNHGLDILEFCCPDDNVLEKYLSKIDNERLNYPIPKLTTYDSNDWFIPEEYKNLNIEKYLLDICPSENLDRLNTELDLYRKHNMFIVLCAMKYIVDTLKNHNIVWGVGRGSSVASYVLFLLGVHKIDSVKYNLPIEEFFKGEKNG